MEGDAPERQLFFDTEFGTVARLSSPQATFAQNRASSIILFEGGAGSGKTTAGAAALLDRVQVNGPEVTSLVVAPSYRQLHKPVIEQINMMCDGFGISHTLNKGEMIMTLYPEQCPVMFRSSELVTNLKGSNVGFLWCDEGASFEEEAWKECARRVRDPRAVVEQKMITTTPEGTETWVEALKSRALVEGSSISITTAATDSNPALKDSYIREMLELYRDDPDGLRQYFYGVATDSKGAIYHLTDANLRPFDRSLLKHAEIVVGQDYNARWMVSVVIAWIPSYNVMHVIGEVVSKDPGGISTEDHAKRVVKWLRDHDLLHTDKHPSGRLHDKWLRPVTAYTDASGDSIHSNAYLTDDAAMRNAGFVVRHDGANPVVRTRIATVNRGFAKRWILMSEKDAPETTRAIRGHSRDKKGKPKKDYRPGEFQADHYCDALGYPAWGLIPFRAENIGVS